MRVCDRCGKPDPVSCHVVFKVPPLAEYADTMELCSRCIDELKDKARELYNTVEEFLRNFLEFKLVYATYNKMEKKTRGEEEEENLVSKIAKYWEKRIKEFKPVT